MSPQTQMRADLAVIAANVAPGARVLDVGCGEGELMEVLQREKGCDARGMEIDPEAVERYDRAGAEANEALKSCAKPTIAMIRGYCIGGGLGLALCCDLRIAAEDASFAIPAAKLGLGYGFTGIKQLADLVGPAFAREILYTARRFSAAEAAHIGLVNQVVPVAALAGRVQETAAMIAGNAPLTIAAAKECVAQWAKLPEDRDLARPAAAVKACFASRDYAEGRAAFRDKRKPSFEGR